MCEELMHDRCCSNCRHNKAEDREEEVACELHTVAGAPDDVCLDFKY